MTVSALQQVQRHTEASKGSEVSAALKGEIVTTMTESHSRRPFADAVPSSTKRFLRPIFTVLLASIGGFHATGSPFIGVVMFFFAMIGALADVFANIILVPPFLQYGDVNSGLCMDKAKLPTYWDSATICGPSAFNYRYAEVEIPMRGKFLRGWLIRPTGASKVIEIAEIAY
jgi:hypothetical protein